MNKRQTIIDVKNNTTAKSVPSGYGPNNPEPLELKDSSSNRQNKITNNSLHAAEEYINHKD